MIAITGVNLVKFAQKAYDLSRPQGLGFLHAQAGGLSEAEAKDLISDTGRIALHMDYVHGRACKVCVFRDLKDTLTIGDQWYDHTDAQLAALLQSLNLPVPLPTTHNLSCNCPDCSRTQPFRSEVSGT